MQKSQDDWPRLAKALEQAIRSAGMDDITLSRASGANYFAIRRMRLSGITNRSKNAKKLCSFFKLVSVDGSTPPPDPDSALLEQSIRETWDGTAAHRRFLEDLLALAGRYRVKLR